MIVYLRVVRVVQMKVKLRLWISEIFSIIAGFHFSSIFICILSQTTISVSVIDQQNKQEEPIELIPNIKEYPLNIEFNKNEIIVCQEETNENTITGFMKELLRIHQNTIDIPLNIKINYMNYFQKHCLFLSSMNSRNLLTRKELSIDFYSNVQTQTKKLFRESNHH